MPSIRLPNGKVVRNVPEGITKEQFQNNAIKAGWATPEDFGLSPVETGGNVEPLTTQATPAALTNGATIPPLSSPGEQQPFLPPSQPVASMSQPRPIQGVDEAPEQFQARVNEWQQPTQPMGQQQPVAPQQPQLPTQQPKPTMQQRVQQFIADAQEVKTGMAESVNQPGFFTESVPDFWSKFSEGLSGKRLAAGFTADLLNTVGNKLRSNVEQNKKRYADQLRAGMITQQEYDRVIELLDQESAQNESMMKSFDLAPEDTAKVREFINKEEEEATPKGLSLVQRGMRSGAVSSMMNAPSTFAAVLGQTPLATAMFALPTYTSSYADAIEEGLDPDTANEYASLQTMVEVGTEANPIQKLKKIGGVFKGKKKEIETLKDKAFDDTLGKDVKDFMLSELGGEQVAFFGQTAIDIKYGMGIGKKWAGMTPEQRFKYLAEGAGESLVATLFAGGGQATLAAGVRRVFGDVDTGKAEKDIAKAIEDMPLQDTAARDYTQPKVIEQEAVQATQDADITEAMGQGEKVAPEAQQPQMGSDTQSPFAQKMQTLDTKAYDDEKSGDEMAAEVATPQDSTMPTTEKPTEKPSVDVAPVTSKEAEKPQAPAEKSTVIPKAKPEVSKKPADVLNQQLPEILTAKKSAIVNKMMKDQGIKKGSPGFAEAKARIESEYEAELDKTLAQQPFEVFNAYNADVPESINRQAYNALRADFGIDNDVKFAKKSGYKGTDPVEAKEWIDAKAKGLPMDEKSRMARAKEMGFDVENVYYHGTNIPLDKLFKEGFDTSDRSLQSTLIPNPKGDNIGSFFSQSKGDAKDFGSGVVGVYLSLKNPKVFKNQAEWQEFNKKHSGVQPDKRDSDGFIVEEGKFEHKARKVLEDQGYDGVIIETPNYVKGRGKPWAVAFYPNQIRSINAAFDPDAADSADLLANREQAERIPESKPEKPVERKDAQQAIDDFLKEYKGVKNIPVKVFDNATEAYGQKIVDKEQLKPGDVSGSFWRGGIQIIRDGNATRDDVTRTLRHEAWVHYGLSLMNPEQKAAFLKRIKGLIAESRELTKIAEGVRKDYTRRDGSFSLKDDVFYEEVAAKIAEKYGDEINDIVTGKIKKPTAFQTQLKKFYDVIVSALRQLGLLDKTVPREGQVQEAIDLVLDRAAALRGVDSKNMRQGKTKGSPLFMVAYHGSPHKFDKFSLAAIGTGEGAQAYGWGLYFAGKRSVAEWYRDKLRHGYDTFFNGELLGTPKTAEEFIAKEVGYLKNDPLLMDAIKDNDTTWDQLLAIQLDHALRVVNPDFKKIVLDSISGFDIESVKTKPKGNLYQVDIPEDSELLDYDKTFEGQSESVKERLIEAAISGQSPNLAFEAWLLKNNIELPASDVEKTQDLIKRYMDETGNVSPSKTSKDLSILNQTGWQLYLKLSSKETTQRAASLFLNEHGIKGLRYLDGTSRDSDGDTHNYVIWDESVITVEAVNDELRQAEEAAPAFARKGIKPFSVDSDFINDPFTVKDADLVEKSVSYFVDRFERVRRVQKQIKEQGGEVATDADTYLAEELYHGKVGNDLDIFDKEIVEKLRDKMRKMGVSRELLDLYLIVRHAPERNRYVKSIRPDMESGSGVSTKEANATRAMLEESEYGSKLKELAADVDKIIRMRNELKVNAGLETKADQSKYPDWKHYVPMKGMAYDEKKGRMSGGGGGLNVQGKEDKVLKGRFSPPDSPLAYVIADMTETIIRARKAEVGNTFLNLVRDNPNPNLWEIFTEAKPDTTTVRVTENGKPVVKKKRMTAAEMKGATRNGMPVYFVTKRNGKEYFIKVKDDRLMDAMRNLGTEDMGVFLQAMATGTRYLSTMLTSFSPEFVVSNFIRDLQTAIYNITGEQTGKEGKLLGQKIAMQTIKDIGRAVSGIVSEEFSTKASEQKEWSKFYREFKEAGAKTGWFDQKSPEQLKKAIDKKLNRGKVADAFSGLLDSVDAVNTSVENAVRLATYVNARKAFEPLVQTGQMTDRESKDRAASLAKNLTVNFNRKGQAGSNLNALYMFANAAIQGNYQFYRTLFMRHPAGGANLTMSQKLAAGSVLVGFFLTLINEAISPDDDDGVSYYSKIPDYVKERNFIIMDHTDDDKKSPQREDYETDAEFKEAYDEFIEGRYTKLPMPYGYNIFTDVGVAVAEMYLGQKTNKEASSFLTTAVLGSFLPIGFPERDSTIESIRSGLVPTLAKPAAELMENRNFFNSPIMQEPFPNDTTPRSQLSKRTTGELWKWTAETLNTVSGGDETVSGAMDYSPDAFEHIWEFVSGGLGKTVNRTMKSVETAAKGEPVATNDIPFLRTVRAEPSKWRHSQYYFENKKLPLQRLDGYERLVEEGMDKEAEIYNETYGEYIILGQISDTIEKNLKKMRKALRRAEADDDKARIADIKQEMDRQYMRFNTAHRKLIRDGMSVEDYMKEVDK